MYTVPYLYLKKNTNIALLSVQQYFIGRSYFLYREINCNIDKLYTEVPERLTIPHQHKLELTLWKEAGYFEITACYTLTEVQEKYRISESTLQQLIKRNSIPEIKKGWRACKKLLGIMLNFFL